MDYSVLKISFLLFPAGEIPDKAGPDHHDNHPVKHFDNCHALNAHRTGETGNEYARDNCSDYRRINIFQHNENLTSWPASGQDLEMLSASDYNQSLMNRIFKFAFSHLNGVKVYALVGRSGTGKSHHSKLVAQKHHIDLIIDDGLLIKGDKILAGHSAKRDPNFLVAVKTAVFDDERHRQEVEEALLKEKYKKILIIGTSEKMVNKIAAKLNLPPVSKVFHIEEVASQEEIETAMRIRYTEGKHVIPVPSIEITRNYPQIVYDSMKVFFGKKKPFQKKQSFEKTIVRPEFSRPDKESISETTLIQMVRHCIDEYDKVIKVKRVRTTAVKNNEYDISVTLQVPLRHYIGQTMSELQEYIADCIEKYGGILVHQVSIEIEEWG